MLELGEEALDSPALGVGDAVVRMLPSAMPTGRDDWLAALFEDDVVQAVGIIGTVGEHLLAGEPSDQVACGSHVVLLARPEREAHRQAERIDYGVELGSEPAA